MLKVLQNSLIRLHHASVHIFRCDQGLFIFSSFILVNSLVPVIFVARCHMGD